MQVHPVVAVPLILTRFRYIVQYVKHMYEGNTCTTQRRKNSICASSAQYPAVTKTSSGLKIAEKQTLAKEGTETTLWSPFLSFYFLFQDPASLIAASDCHCDAGMPKDAAPALKKFSLSVNNV